MESKLKNEMVEKLNLQLKKDGSSLSYRVRLDDKFSTSYELFVDDKFIDQEVCCSISINKEFEKYVRDFFAKLGVYDTGYNNSVLTLIAWKL